MKRRARWWRWGALLVVLALVWTKGAQGQRGSRRISQFDLFGYAGIDVTRLEGRLDALRGKALTEQTAAEFRRRVQAVVNDALGSDATDVAMICCDAKGGLDVFVGLRGGTFHQVTHAPAPAGRELLPANGLTLYRRDERAIAEAIRRGVAGEDDAYGYPLSLDAGARMVQHEMRAYAIQYPAEIRTVLLTSADAEQRRAAATLLGYAVRTRPQIAALSAAMDDADEEVRNNAMRTLGVMGSVGPLDSLDARALVRLLYSGVWTDRNKASSVLSRLTAKRDPRLLDLLRQEALPGLLEGARWHSRPHAYFFLQVLGRVEGMDEKAIAAAISSGKTEAMLRAAEAH